MFSSLGPLNRTSRTDACDVVFFLCIFQALRWRWQKCLKKFVGTSFERMLREMLSSRCIGTFTPPAALLRARALRAACDSLPASCLLRTAVSIRADAFPPFSPCAGTSATTPQQQQPAAAAAAAVSGGSSSQQQPAAAAAAAKTAAAAALAPRRAATAGDGFR